ncbi:MAG TPA: hypothetical protein VGO29_13870 [Solirubrobacteraceae bacterium]|nr:hypothetical protein [Solirubrobacteraceae bacterium]
MRVRLCLLLCGSVAYAALLVLLRGRPSLKSDAGVFLSVAGSLLHGDRLYVGVIDNKDPLFFYAHAASLEVFGWTGPFLLDVLWIAIAAGSTLLLLRAIGASWLTAALGFLTYPLLLTGAWYLSGYSLLAALSFAPLIGWLWIRDRFVLAGALLGVGMLFKVNLALVLASVPVTMLVLHPRGARAQVAKALGGLGLVAAVAALALALRGELDGYLKNFKDNISYSHEVLRATGNMTGVPGHIKVAAGAASKPVHFAGLPVGKPLHLAVIAAAFLVAGFFAIRTLRERPATCEPTSRFSATRVLAALFLCSTVTTAVTLALTAAWSPHDQMLALPGVMLIAFVAAKAAPAVIDPPRAAAVCVAAALGVVVLGGTAAAPFAREGGVGYWFDSARSETANLLERAAASRFPKIGKVTFAHLGQNDEEGVAAFLDGRFSLACPAIAQYVFTPHLDSVLRCVSAKRPQLILVTQKLQFVSGAPAQWNQFVARGSRLLAQNYQRVSARNTPSGSASVWALAGEASKHAR